MSQLENDIQRFNAMYKLPVSAIPTLCIGVDPVDRLKAFKDILAEELNEIDEIIADFDDPDKGSLDVLTKLADLLGDIQVYCASEMAKFGIPLDHTLAIIMQSNFSKLGADGLPIYDERGKVLKGPGYYRPEPEISKALSVLMGNGGN